MFRFFRAARFPFVSQHPALVFAGVFIPLFLIANAILAAIGQPKQPHDIAIVLRNVLVDSVIAEFLLALYRRLDGK